MAETEKNKIDLVDYLLKIAPSISVFDMVQAKLDRYGNFAKDSVLSKIIFSNNERKTKETNIFRGMFRSNIKLKFSNATIVKEIPFYDDLKEYTQVNDYYFYYLVYVDPSENVKINIMPNDENTTDVDILGVAF